MRRARKNRKYRLPMSKESKRRVYVILLWIGVAVAALAVGLAVGNALGNKADGYATAFGDRGSAPIYLYEGGEAPAISAVALSGISGKIISAVEPSARAVSVVLRSGSGAPRYSSETARAVTGNSGGTDDLEAAVATLKGKGIYVSAIFNVNFASATDKTVRESVMAYETALICEILKSGVDEVVITGLPNTESGLADASLLFKNVRDAHPGAVLGAAFSYKLIESGSAAWFIESYGGFADFCAMDAGGMLKASKTVSEFASEHLIYFEKYPLRVMAEATDSAHARSVLSALAAIGIYNVQCIHALPVAAG